MKKTVWSLLLLMVVSLILFGCKEQHLSESTTTGDIVEKPVIGVAENPGSNLIEYDADRTLYITLQNCDMDLYTDTGAPGFSFYIFSKEPLETEAIQVSLPIKADYQFLISQIPDLRQKGKNGEFKDTSFPLYLYQIYAGVNWQELADFRTSNGVKDNTNCEEILLNTTQDFEKMPLSDIPEFYVYTAIIVLGQRNVEETWEYVDFTINGQVIRQCIGSVRIHTNPLPASGTVTVLDYGSLMQSFMTDAWSDGSGQGITMTFTAEEDMTLTNLRLPECDSITNFSITLSLATEAGNYSRQWDPQEPVDIFKGETVTVTVEFRDARLQQLHAQVAYYGVLEYETEEGKFCAHMQKFLIKTPNFHELYAIVFNGVDVEPYYRFYYYPIYKHREALD